MSTTATGATLETTPAVMAGISSVVHEEMCCYPGEALCGQNLKGDIVTDTAVTCPVCINLGDSGLECARIRAGREPRNP